MSGDPMSYLRAVCARVERQDQLSREALNDRDRVLARLHQQQMATHRELGRVAGLTLSGVRAAVARGARLIEDSRAASDD